MVPGVKPLHISIALVPRHNGREDTARKHFQHPAQDRILIAHARLHFLSLDNQKVALKSLRRLACPRDKVNHSPDSPARKRGRRTEITREQKLLYRHDEISIA